MKWRKSNNGKRVADGCRNHGPCGVCLGNRLHSTRVREQAADHTEAPEDPNDRRCDDLWDHPSDAYDYELTGGGTLYRPLLEVASFRKMLAAQHNVGAGRDSAGR